MVKQIVLSLNAEKDRLSILEYYNESTGNNKYSLKLFNILTDAFETISNFPYSGKKLKRNNHFVFTIKHYNIIYKIEINFIVILHIWDTRQNPENLPL